MNKIEYPIDIPRYRLGQTIYDYGCAVRTNGVEVSLEGRDITVFLVDPRGTARRISWRIDSELNYVVRFDYEGYKQELEGLYRVKVFENYKAPSQAVFECMAFVLLKHIPHKCSDDDMVLEGGTLFIGGVSVVSIDIVSESTESGGENVWRATRSDGQTFDLVVRNGAKGDNGYTPYVQDNYWYINGENTGVRATVGLEEIHIDDTTGEMYVEI